MTKSSLFVKGGAKITHVAQNVPASWLLLFVGQVDVDFLFLMRQAADPSLTFEEHARAAVRNLLLFLEELTPDPETFNPNPYPHSH